MRSLILALVLSCSCALSAPSFRGQCRPSPPPPPSFFGSSSPHIRFKYPGGPLATESFVVVEVESVPVSLASGAKACFYFWYEGNDEYSDSPSSLSLPRSVFVVEDCVPLEPTGTGSDAQTTVMQASATLSFPEAGPVAVGVSLLLFDGDINLLRAYQRQLSALFKTGADKSNCVAPPSSASSSSSSSSSSFSSSCAPCPSQSLASSLAKFSYAPHTDSNVSFPLDPGPDADVYLTRFINALNVEVVGSVVPLANVSAALFPTWKSLMRPSWDALPLRVADVFTASRVAVIVEPRVDADLPGLIKHTMWMLNYPHGDEPDRTAAHAYNEVPPGAPPPLWALHIFHSPQNARQLHASLFGADVSLRRKVRLTSMTSLSRDSYSALLTSSLFLSSLSPASHFFVFQSDVAALRPGPLDEFLAFDYVGAPWSWCTDPNEYCWLFGNGGASLRRRESMLQLTSEVTCDRAQCKTKDAFEQDLLNSEYGKLNASHFVEDCWLAARAHQMRDELFVSLPPRDVSHRFSSETMLPYVSGTSYDFVEPFFLHQAWRYLPPPPLMSMLARVQRYYW